MKSALKKIALATLLCIGPLAAILCKDFIYTSRGFHTEQIRYEIFYWLTRLLLAPLLVLITLKLWQLAKNPYKLFLHTAIVFIFYNFLCWSISFISCRFGSSAFDGRNKNLFDTIRNDSTPQNLLVYILTVSMVLAWLYFERNKESEMERLELEKSLAEAKMDLIKIQTHLIHPGENQKSGFIPVKNGHKTILVPLSEISCIRSNGPYISIVTEQGNFLLKKTLIQFQKTLPVSFLRVHRSSIVNMEFVKEFRSLLNGDALLILKNENEVRSSRTYRESILNVLGKL